MMKITRTTSTLTAAVVWSLLGVPGTVAAQEATDTTRPVTERPRPDYDPLGIRAGAFLILPKIELTELYNDNVFAEEDDEESDFITIISPSVLARSNWSNHALAFRAEMDVGRYADNESEDFTDFVVETDGRLDVQRATQAFGGLGYRQSHEARGEPDAPTDAAEPTEYSVLYGNLAGQHRFNRVSVRLGAEVQDFDYDDVPDIGGGIINNDDRDRIHYTTTLRGGYEISPDSDVFARIAYNVREYDAARDDAGLNRDSSGWRYEVGTDLRISPLTQAELFVGYLVQDYDDPALANVEGVSFGGSVDWSPTPLTTLRGFASRNVVEATENIGAASGALETIIGATVDHEFLRNLILGARLSYGIVEYEGVDREDNTWRAGLSADYLVTRNFYLRGEYGFVSREAEGGGNDFDQNLFLVRLGAQL